MFVVILAIATALSLDPPQSIEVYTTAQEREPKVAGPVKLPQGANTAPLTSVEDVYKGMCKKGWTADELAEDIYRPVAFAAQVLGVVSFGPRALSGKSVADLPDPWHGPAPSPPPYAKRATSESLGKLRGLNDRMPGGPQSCDPGVRTAVEAILADVRENPTRTGVSVTKWLQDHKQRPVDEVIEELRTAQRFIEKHASALGVKPGPLQELSRRIDAAVEDSHRDNVEKTIREIARQIRSLF